MHPPAWVCESIAKIHPPLRLAWKGEEGEGLNQGHFAIVELYDLNHCGSMDDPKLQEQFWDLEWFQPVDGIFMCQRAERGPIFAKDGRPIRDWDNTRFKPVLKQVFDEEWGFTIADIFNGFVVEHVRERVMSLNEKKHRRRKQAVQQGLDMESRIKDLSGEMTSALWHDGNQTGSTYVDMPWEFAKENLPKRFHQFKESDKLDFTNMYLEDEGL